MFRKLRKTRWRHPSLRERVEQARAEIERSRAELARTAGEAGEASRLTISKLVTAWRDWAAAKPAPPLPPVIAAASRADPIEVTLNRVRAQRPPAPPVTPRQPFSATPSAACHRTPAYAADPHRDRRGRRRIRPARGRRAEPPALRQFRLDGKGTDESRRGPPRLRAEHGDRQVLPSHDDDEYEELGPWIR